MIRFIILDVFLFLVFVACIAGAIALVLYKPKDKEGGEQDATK